MTHPEIPDLGAVQLPPADHMVPPGNSVCQPIDPYDPTVRRTARLQRHEAEEDDPLGHDPVDLPSAPLTDTPLDRAAALLIRLGATSHEPAATPVTSETLVTPQQTIEHLVKELQGAKRLIEDLTGNDFTLAARPQTLSSRALISFLRRERARAQAAIVAALLEDTSDPVDQ